jgi:hypothetical protein
MKKHVDVFNKLIRRFIISLKSHHSHHVNWTSHFFFFQIQVSTEDLWRERSHRFASVHQQVRRSWLGEAGLLSGPVHLHRVNERKRAPHFAEGAFS